MTNYDARSVFTSCALVKLFILLDKHQVIDASSEKHLHSTILQSVLISNSPVPVGSQAVFLDFEAAPAAGLL